jgi:hypothetical protein
MSDFQIVTRGMPALAEEWILASRAPESQLPQLTEVDRSRARGRYMSEEQYARHLLLRSYASGRETEEAKQIGEIVISLFGDLNGGFELKGVVKRGAEAGWHILIESRSAKSGSKVFDILLPTEDFSGEGGKDLLDVHSPEEIRGYLVSALNVEQVRKVAS